MRPAQNLFPVFHFISGPPLPIEKPLHRFNNSSQGAEQRRESKGPPLDPYGVNEEIYQEPIRAAENEEDAKILGTVSQRSPSGSAEEIS